MSEFIDDFSIHKDKIKYGNKYVARDENGSIASQASYYNYNVKNFDWILVADVETIPKYRGMGLATKLMKKIEDDVKKEYPKKGIYMFVKTDNAPAIKLYKKLGYKYVKNYMLEDGADYCIMCKGDADISQFDNMKFK